MGPSVNWSDPLGRRLSRRRLLQTGSVGGLTFLAWGIVGCGESPPTESPGIRRRRRADAPIVEEPAAYTAQMSEWSRHARLANATGLSEDPAEEEMRQIVEALQAQNVSVVEVDTVLSDWLGDDEFEAAMAVATQFNRFVHRSGLKVVWYYPSLEVISPGGELGPSFSKAYPDWLQMSINGRPNVFHGGVVFWVEPGDESAWLSPDGPWRQYYLNRIRRLALTGADGIWPDVPLYFAGVVPWCDLSSWGRAAFSADTGLLAPAREDWADPTWRRWIEWRHRNLNKFLLEIAATGRAVNHEFETFVETVTMDYMDATSIGLDGAYLRLAEGVTQVWEVDVVSESDGMRYATDDDWICLISMYKYARAASGKKPAWAFSYGLEEDDAAQVMGECLAAGCNPYEVKTPEKTAGVSGPMRERLYAFVKANTERLFNAASLAKVAVYHSSASRDYVSPTEGTGLFASTTKPDQVAKWWSVLEGESCYQKQWLAEFRGTVKALLHAHISFNVVTSPTLQPEDVDDFSVLILPDTEAMSDGEAAIMRHFVDGGGTIIITGPNPTGLNEFGDPRPEYALADILGISKRSPLPSERRNQFGSGNAVYFSDLPGGDYLRRGTSASLQRITGAVQERLAPFLAINADRRVHLEASRLGDETILQFTNLTGVRGSAGFEVTPTAVSVSMATEGRRVKAVDVSSPDRATPDLTPVEFSSNAGQISFNLAVVQYSLVVVTWE